ATGEIVADASVVSGPVAAGSVSVPPGSMAFVVASPDGRVLVQRVVFGAAYEGGRRVAKADLPVAVAVVVHPAGPPVARATAQVSRDGENVAVAAATADGRVVLVRTTATTNAMTGAIERLSSQGEAPLPPGVTLMLLDVAQANLYIGMQDGRIGWFRVGADG